MHIYNKIEIEISNHQALYYKVLKMNQIIFIKVSYLKILNNPH